MLDLKRSYKKITKAIQNMEVVLIMFLNEISIRLPSSIIEDINLAIASPSSRSTRNV